MNILFKILILFVNMNSNSNNSNSPKIGIPHFKGTLKQARASGYTLNRAVNDIIDNIIFMAYNIFLEIVINSETDELNSLIFYDDYENGFENIEKEGENNPLNMAHTRLGHSNDEETSEFGMGLKLASMYLGNRLTVITRILNELEEFSYLRIEFDFNKMSQQKDPILSYEYSCYYEITKEAYLQQHKYKKGSKIIIDGIRKDAYQLNNIDTNLIKNLNNTFSNIILKRKLKISVDMNFENPTINIPKINYLEHPNCSPLNTSSKIYILHDNNDLEIYIETTLISGRIKYTKYDIFEEKIIQSNPIDFNLFISK